MKNIILLCFLMVSSFIAATVQDGYDIIVDRNGTGHFRNIQQALDSARNSMNEGKPITIFIKKGYYKEKLVLDSLTHHVNLVGEDKNLTIINYDDHANIDKMGTFRTYTFLIKGNNIVLENLTVENSAAQQGQAVALHIEGNYVTVRNCRLLGNQDTLYAGAVGSKHYFENCYIEGTTDFIFGSATVWFEACTIHCKKNSYITAANTPQDIQYGFILNNCDITFAEGVNAIYLGRPWRPYSMTLYMHCKLPKGILPAGWDNWRNPKNEETVRYIEYDNHGDGANTSERVSWAKILTRQEAEAYTIDKVLTNKDGWNPLIIK